MEAWMLTELPCEGQQKYLQRKKGLATEMLIETVERPGMKSPPRTLRVSSHMWGPRRIFSQRRAPQEVLRAPCLLDVEECHLERGSSSAVELCGKGNLRKWEIID